MKNKILILDTETTGFSPKKNHIVELGIVELNIKTGAIKPLFDSVIKEDGLTVKDHKAWIFENSSLTVDMVREAPSLESLREEIQGIFFKYSGGVTAFNRQFDMGFLKERDFAMPKFQPCPMLTLAPIMQLPHKNGRGLGKRPSVEEAMAYLFPDEEYKEEHRGCQDAEDEARIVFECIKRGWYKCV